MQETITKPLFNYSFLHDDYEAIDYIADSA